MKSGCVLPFAVVNVNSTGRLVSSLAQLKHIVSTIVDAGENNYYETEKLA